MTSQWSASSTKTVAAKAVARLAFMPWKISVQNSLRGLKEKQASWKINKSQLTKAQPTEVDWACVSWYLLLKPGTVIITKRFFLNLKTECSLCFIYSKCYNALQQFGLMNIWDETRVVKKLSICSKSQLVSSKSHMFSPEWPLTSDVIFQTAHIHSQPIWWCGGKRRQGLIAG